MHPQFPIYIVSKGRYDSLITHKTLDKMGTQHFLVIEEQEYKLYAKKVNKKNLIILDKQFQRDYATCDDLGNEKSKGPGAARNFAWQHSIDLGYDWHWVMDDNIQNFYRFDNNIRIPVYTGAIFTAMEYFVLRYTNIGMAGPNYKMFVPDNYLRPAYILNTRIYSCNLIRNDIDLRWRGRYNEDTDLSIRMMQKGYVTVQFNAFLQDKITTQVIKGGNTDDFYAKEGTFPKSIMQEKLHPKISKVVWKYGRWHHFVDYSIFQNKLEYKPGIQLSEKIDNFGMILKKIK